MFFFNYYIKIQFINDIFRCNLHIKSQKEKTFKATKKNIKCQFSLQLIMSVKM